MTTLANTPEYLEGDLRVYTMEVTQRTKDTKTHAELESALDELLDE